MNKEDRTPEPMHPAIKKFLELLFQDVTVEGISRRLEFIDDGDGEATVKLHAPNNVRPPIHLGFPENWWPPSVEEWNESLAQE